MTLERYRSRRRMGKTPEPGVSPTPGRRSAAGAMGSEATGAEATRYSGQFVVQLHAARHLHCDFRLEWPDGVLKSWAVPKGPSLDPATKRLAVHVEDHPLDYARFEGTIPSGEYGAGRVIVWDQGTWRAVDDPQDGYDRGHLKFELEGVHLHGRWALVRTGGRDGHDGADGNAVERNWLLIKDRDLAARRDAPFNFDDSARSVLSDRSLGDIGPRAASRSGSTSASASAAADAGPSALAASPAQATTDAPLQCELATEVTDAPQGPGWWFETKFDGYRILAHLSGRQTRLVTRSGLDWTHRFPSIARAMAQTDAGSCWLDGEMVVFDTQGLSRFQRLQGALAGGDDRAIRYMVFDALVLDGTDLRALKLAERKQRLSDFLTQHPIAGVHLSPHVGLDADTAKAQACAIGLEGLIAKRFDSPYRAGRSLDWVKLKCRKRQEFVIVGYTDPRGAREHLGALLLGYADADADADADIDTGADTDAAVAWRYAGRVGTGFDRQSLAGLLARLRPLRIDACVLGQRPALPGLRVHWVRPELVCEVEFAEWTQAGLIRQASFLGLREDKSVEDVKRERALPTPSRALPARAATPSSPPKPARRRTLKTPARLTHPERIVFPREGQLRTPVTKQALADYYAAVAPQLLAHLRNRPLSIVRAPEGLPGERFFQQHWRSTLGASVEAVPIADAHGRVLKHICVRDAPGLAALVQMGTVELHGWGCRTPAIERPDRLAFDLDPDEALPWAKVVQAGELSRSALQTLGLKTMPMITGGKGLHLTADLSGPTNWADLSAFARAFAEHLARTLPTLFTASPLKAKRGGKIFVDYLRNRRGATAVMPYSVRLRAGATVATPLTWEELRDGARAQDFDVRTVVDRLESGVGAAFDPQPRRFDLAGATARLRASRTA